MSEHATTAPAVRLGEQAVRQPARVAEGKPAELVAEEDGKDWPLAAIFFSAVLGLYAAVAGALYLLVTSLT